MPSPLRFLSAPCAFAAALMAGLALLPARAQACTYAQVILEASYPRWGAVDVPTNAVLFIYGPELGSADDVRLLDTTSGESVPFEVHAAPSGLDLTPLDALAPNREYQLVDADRGAILEFTTGSTPAAPAPALSAPKVDATVFEYFLGSCGLQTGLCLQRPDQLGTTLEVRVAEEVLRDNGAPWPMSRAYGGPISETDCIEFRLRDALGHRSEPTVACGAAVRRVELDNPNFNQEVTCANYLDFVKASTPGLGPDGRPLPPDRGSPPQREMSPEPQLVNARDVAYAGDGSEATPRSSAATGCVLTRAGSGAPRLAGLGLALAAALAARRRNQR